MNEEGRARRPGTPSTDPHPRDRVEGTTDLQARLGTATRVAVRWLAGEPVTDAELEAFILLLDRCENDAERFAA